MLHGGKCSGGDGSYSEPDAVVGGSGIFEDAIEMAIRGWRVSQTRSRKSHCWQEKEAYGSVSMICRERRED